MSQLSGKLTSAGHALIANCIANGTDLNLTDFVFANVPDLDPDTLPDNYDQTIPTAHIVHTAPVTRSAAIDDDTVVYSVVLNSTIGDFDFNWIGLVDDGGQLAMLKYVPTQEKRGNEFGEGNNLNRNFALKFTGAATVTNITIPAESWQYDVTPQLVQLQTNINLLQASIFYDAAKDYAVDDACLGTNGRKYICIQANGPSTTVKPVSDESYWLIEYKFNFHKSNPVGRVLISHDDTNPGNIFGTWQLIGKGRTLVGVDPGDTAFDTPGKTGGAKTHSHDAGDLQADGHQLTVDELPKFRVDIPFATGESDGGNTGDDVRAYGQPAREWTAQSDEVGGDQPHGHGVSGATANASSMPPYICEYFWKRTA